MNPAAPAALVLGQDPTGHRWRPFAVASAMSALALVALVGWMRFGFGGERAMVAVEDVASTGAALAAASICAWSARKATGRRALSGWLLTSMAAVWAVVQAIQFTYDVGFAVAPTSPSAADAAIVGAYLLGAAAVVAVPARRSRLSTRGRTWLDGGTIALSLLFVGLVLGLDKHFHPYSHGWVLGQNHGLAYPLVDILVVTLVVLAIRRNAHSSQSDLLLWLAGLAVIALTDFAGSLVTEAAADLTVGAGFIAGFVLIGLSRLWPASGADSSDLHAPVTLWQMAVPWMALVLVLATSVIATAWGHRLDNS